MSGRKDDAVLTVPTPSPAMLKAGAECIVYATDDNSYDTLEDVAASTWKAMLEVYARENEGDEITDEMVEDGAATLEYWRGSAHDEFMVKEIYKAMRRGAVPRPG